MERRRRDPNYIKRTAKFGRNNTDRGETSGKFVPARVSPRAVVGAIMSVISDLFGTAIARLRRKTPRNCRSQFHRDIAISR